MILGVLLLVFSLAMPSSSHMVYQTARSTTKVNTTQKQKRIGARNDDEEDEHEDVDAWKQYNLYDLCDVTPHNGYSTLAEGGRNLGGGGSCWYPYSMLMPCIMH